MINNNTNVCVGDIPIASISISPLGTQSSQQIFIPLNESVLFEHNKQLNSLANFREVLIEFTTNLTIVSINNIKLQFLSLTQLTGTSLIIVLKKTDQLVRHLYSISERIPYEDIQIATTQLIQYANLNIDFNLGQNSAINTAQVLFSLEILLMQYLSNKCIKQVGHAEIYIPSIFNKNKMISLQVGSKTNLNQTQCLTTHFK
ncbi:unnamed protein product [Adineta steineri]|uniref:Uncharacterized protein n=1 Tax=Adineta steineri TaxID=433720 RepID=A0A815SF56_9BILA|nr:unnamed protein product [Adineta steineri]CAF1491137.1 unnamed protein product [Adineta steineri]